MNKEQLSLFQVTIFEKLEKYNDVISKGRCRIFYKGKNRNYTFISDEFAEKLISTISYTPIKGIYDSDDEDYTDHGKKRTMGRIYGVVPENPNFAWEKHKDEDGIEREYACVDVLLYTALYKEAEIINGKGQSMELYANSIKGDWKKLGDKEYYYYTDACFLGLQVLGNDVEPCFEGAAFYSLFQSMKEFISEIEKYNKSKNNLKGEQTMSKLLFKLSDDDKRDKLYRALNTEVDEEGYNSYYYSVCSVYDEYAIVYEYSKEKYYRAYYTKGEEDVTIDRKEECYIIDVNAVELSALKNLRTLVGDTYEKVDETYSALSAKVLELQNLDTKIKEQETEIATLKTEKEEAESAKATTTADYSKAKEKITELEASLETLSSYKKNVELEAKKAIINNYVEFLSDDVIQSFITDAEKYTCEELDMKLTYAQKKSNPNAFQKTENSGMIPKDDNIPSGINTILDKYEKKKK